MAEDVLATLGNEDDDERSCENQLVLMLDYDKFDLIKKLLKNRTRIVWCTRLTRAQNEEERAIVMERMRARPEAAKVLDALTRGGNGLGSSSRARWSPKSARRRAACAERWQRTSPTRTRGAARRRRGERSSSWTALAFAQGSHFMSNKRCELPRRLRSQRKEGEPRGPAHSSSPNPRRSRITNLRGRSRSSRRGRTPRSRTGMKSLNRVQSQRVRCGRRCSPRRTCSSAPPRRGEDWWIAMLTILHELGLHRRRTEASTRPRSRSCTWRR